MHRVFATGVAALGLACAFAPTPAAAGLVVLGDSTVDAGSAQLGAELVGAPDPTPAEEGYFEGRFSNGPNAADYVSQALGQGLTVSYLAGGDNYAFGGAAIVTDVNQGPGGLPAGIPDLTEQVDTYLTGGPIGTDTDLFVSVGGNDFLAVTYGLVSPEEAARGAIEGLIVQLARLAEAGATDVAVSNVNATGFRAGSSALGDAVLGYNAALADALVELTVTTGTRFALVDRNAVFERIIADPLAFGFDPALLGQACTSDPAAAPACDGYVLFDPTHVTTRAQELVAFAVLDALGGAEAVPLPGALALFVTGLAGLTGARRGRGA